MSYKIWRSNTNRKALRINHSSKHWKVNTISQAIRLVSIRSKSQSLRRNCSKLWKKLNLWDWKRRKNRDRFKRCRLKWWILRVFASSLKRKTSNSKLWSNLSKWSSQTAKSSCLTCKSIFSSKHRRCKWWIYSWQIHAKKGKCLRKIWCNR